MNKLQKLSHYLNLSENVGKEIWGNFSELRGELPFTIILSSNVMDDIRKYIRFMK